AFRHDARDHVRSTASAGSYDQLDRRCGVALGDRGGAAAGCQGKDAREQSDELASLQRDELSTIHSITSSARSRNGSEIFSPSGLAVVMLMTSSNFVGCSTGRSAGLAPLSTLST